MHRVTLVHGFLGSPADWAEVLAALEPGIACDCVPLVELGCASVAEAALALGRRLESRPCDLLVGYSLGGRIALELAATQREHARRLLLMSASPGLEDTRERATRAAEDDARARALLAQGLGQFLDAWYAQAIFAPFRGSASFSTARLRRAQGEASFWAACVAGCSPGRAAPRWTALAGLASRTTIAVGARDERYAAFAARAEQLVPAPRVERIADAGHVLPLEAPAACAHLIAASLCRP